MAYLSILTFFIIYWISTWKTRNWYKSILHKNKRLDLSLNQKALKGGWVLFFLSSRSKSLKDNLVSFTRCVYERCEMQSLWETVAARGHTTLARWKTAGEKHCPRVCGPGFGDPCTQFHSMAPLTETGQHYFFFRNHTPRRSWHSAVIPSVSHTSAKPHLLNSARQLKLDMSNWEADFFFFLHRKNERDKNSS